MSICTDLIALLTREMTLQQDKPVQNARISGRIWNFRILRADSNKMRVIDRKQRIYLEWPYLLCIYAGYTSTHAATNVGITLHAKGQLTKPNIVQSPISKYYIGISNNIKIFYQMFHSHSHLYLCKRWDNRQQQGSIGMSTGTSAHCKDYFRKHIQHKCSKQSSQLSIHRPSSLWSRGHGFSR